MRKGWGLVVIGASAALLALLVYGVASESDDTSIDEAVAAGERPAAPDGTLEVLGEDGAEDLAEHRGEVIVLNFWASWCPPCVDELPLLEDVHRDIESSGGTVLGVNYKDIPEDAQRFERDYGVTYPSLRDPDGEFAERYGVKGIPETFLIDRNGDIAALERGPVDREWLEEELAPLLGEKEG
jgi:cytochrome c biogenesis protein CcmG/thiol:disulfide interchange protein DsbE